jgi:hypothetical protein
LIVSGIISLARQIAAEDRKKMKRPAVVDPDNSWSHRRHGSAHIVDMADV